MEKWQKQALRVFKPNFVKDVDNIDALLDLLDAKEALAEPIVRDIREKSSTADKARAIIDHLGKRHPDAFDLFYECLIENDNGNLADELKPELAPCPKKPRKKGSSASKQPGTPQQVVDDDKTEETDINVRLPCGLQPSLVEDDDLPEVWPDPSRSVFNIKVKTVVAENMKQLFEHQRRPEYGGYSLTSFPKGRALIIANTYFTTLPQRMGTDMDLMLLENTFKALGFTIVLRKNCTKSQLLDALKQEAEHRDHVASKAFVFVIMSHGTRGAVKTTDEENVTLDEIMTYFNRDNCPDLVNKPKMFFVQACQGDKQDSGGSGEFADSAVDEIITGVENFGLRNVQQSETTDASGEKVPLYSDMILVNSTCPGFVSWKSDNGTWFIRALTEVLADYAYKNHLLDMLTKVNKLIALAKTQKSKSVQISNTSFNTLRDSIYFFPGLPEQATPSGGRLIPL